MILKSWFAVVKVLWYEDDILKWICSEARERPSQETINVNLH